MPRIRVQFAHGLEGSPSGAKAQALSEHFDTHTPAMDTSNFEACVELHAQSLDHFQPDVLIGSSYGGAVATALLQRGRWSGPTLLLAQAALRLGLPARLPAGVLVWIVHGRGDALIDPVESRQLASAGRETEVRLIEVDDDHTLHASVESGALIDWVRELHALASR
jgi:predicted esterase